MVQKNDRDYGGFTGGCAAKKVEYSHDLIANEALNFVKQAGGDETKSKPFFLYLSMTIPHANNEATKGVGDDQEAPDYGQYASNDWSNPNKGQAEMISRMDADVDRLLDLLLYIYHSNLGANSSA